ncbi:toxin Tbo-IT2-like isoform X2 [Uloborus diversus]|uniref:toxin Tbo-IT2-like isoform X2 n=1 Tax=Uloborus diversus TaxID=327109 RepID=UPI002409213C|nr:toxin Tbo-IT2-like isoform X2 [Uloborus diversus]
MKYFLKPLVVTVLLLCYVFVADAYLMHDSSLDSYQEPAYYENFARYLMSTKKRSCIRRGSSCDHRPSDCCFNSSCRCNLWGTNCRCQRVGLFQKWGK